MNRHCRFLFFVLLGALSTGVFAQNVNEQTRRRQEIEREIKAIDSRLANTQAQHKATLLSLSLIQQKAASRKQLLLHIEEQVRQANDSINKKESEIEMLQADYKELERIYLHIVYRAYLHRNKEVWVAYLLESKSLGQAYRRWQYFKDFSRYANEKASELQEMGKQLDAQINELKKLRSQAEVLRQERQEEVAILNAEERESKQLISTMSQEERTLKAQLQQKKSDLDKVNKELSRILAEAEKNRKTAGAKVQEVDRALAANFEQNKGKLPWPIDQGVVVEPYGQHNHPVLKSIKMPFNPGIGISGILGGQVRAVFQGEVKQIVLIPEYQQCVMIQHGSYYTFYCKLGSVIVKTGDKVSTGDAIGTLAQTNGTSTLHFELWKGTQKQNPELWLRKR
ncbi:MAG: peptidoglycan DD-metalloendopeptidase family protein [Prevotellaceae bacterium]|jgi:septal ring factor EnvC (AmiA/AmiB activator)|nr:peptidoglycan DD-metalloendopeptidase family protein [Prevotellaceae bacterium]